MKLVVVESPSKTKKIKEFLGKDYQVVASMGHIVDLPLKKLGVDTQNYFTPEYTIAEGKKKTITELKKSFQFANELILATDLDREGEAIAWHVAREVGAIKKDTQGKVTLVTNKRIKRIIFSEITKSAVQKAMSCPRDIDIDLVDAQQARRVLDRLVGYKLSPFLWSKIRGGLSAGRVQSVAVRLVVDREREISTFKTEEYWKILLDPSKEKTDIKTRVVFESSESKELPLFSMLENKFKTKEEVDDTIEKLKALDYTVESVDKSDVDKRPQPPLITSTLQQEAVKTLGLTSKKIMSIAQELYEAGLITYMRTDNTELSKEAKDSARQIINEKFGNEYVPTEANKFKSSSKVAQEAHEAIRPVHFKDTPENSELIGDKKAVYALIWNRAVASQMKSAKFAKEQIIIKAKEYRFKASGQRLLFDGYLKLEKKKIEDKELPALQTGDIVYPKVLVGHQKFTKPPQRYTEATLIKKLEKLGVGRPSTYATIISTIEGRGYVSREKKFFVPDEIAFAVTDLLTEHFPKIVDVRFSSELENQLDEIANGKTSYLKTLTKFYVPFEKTLLEKEKKISKDKYSKLEETDQRCPECGGEMRVVTGKYGKFASCPRYPECKGTVNLEEKNGSKTADTNSSKFQKKYEPAPTATDGTKMVLRKGRFGQFWSHSNPKIKDTKPLLLKEKCPECGHNLTEKKARKKFIGCSNYPKCKYIKK